MIKVQCIFNNLGWNRPTDVSKFTVESLKTRTTYVFRRAWLDRITGDDLTFVLKQADKHGPFKEPEDDMKRFRKIIREQEDLDQGTKLNLE